jgi:cellulose biosynthesis protein BcsQ
MIKFTLINSKGGVGKTTLTANLQAGDSLAEERSA